MKNNVSTWLGAISNGFNPSEFTYEVDGIPKGEIVAELVCKIWANKVVAINCYFREVSTGVKFLLTVYCNKAGAYQLLGSGVNFSNCVIGQKFKLTIGTRNSGKIHFIGAVEEKK